MRSFPNPKWPSPSNADWAGTCGTYPYGCDYAQVSTSVNLRVFFAPRAPRANHARWFSTGNRGGLRRYSRPRAKETRTSTRTYENKTTNKKTNKKTTKTKQKENTHQKQKQNTNQLLIDFLPITGSMGVVPAAPSANHCAVFRCSQASWPCRSHRHCKYANFFMLTKREQII